MKFGQLLAGGTEQDDPLHRLVGTIAPTPLREIRHAIAKALGRPVECVFEDIEESRHAASLGQVHKARLTSGETVAVKIQYPGIAEAVASEMKLFGLMPGIGPVRTWGFDLDGYKRALKANMDRELDYRDEAFRQARYRDAVRVPGLVVPAPHPDLTSKTLLIQAWEPSLPTAAARDWTEETRLQVARILLRTLLTSLIDIGEVHGDPHPGNYGYRLAQDGSAEVVLMDFGCTVEVTRDQRLALLAVIIAIREQIPFDAVGAFEVMGFDRTKLEAIEPEMSELARLLFIPFSHRGPFTVSDWGLKRRLDELLGEHKWWFRASGPPAHILLLRSFFGLAQQLEALNCSLDWWEELERSLPVDRFEEARSMPFFRSHRVTEPAPLHTSGPTDAKNLHVHVTEAGEDLVRLSMPASAALRLDELIPPDVLEHLKETDEWDVPSILSGIQQRGLIPQEIMHFQKGMKSYRIWLE
jgi:predicted unusual protein kinase regulating ubiquinone biosynthesis (AarF/ABC1/UbiB family)